MHNLKHSSAPLIANSCVQNPLRVAQVKPFPSNDGARLRFRKLCAKVVRALVAPALLITLAMSVSAVAQDIPAPAGSSTNFGKTVRVLPNGNFLVTDPNYTLPGQATQVGAVYLYRVNRTLISRVTGTSDSDHVGNGFILVLPNSNVVVQSPDWDNGSAGNAGAITFINGSTGLAGTVSVANSLIGATTNDQLGSRGLILLTNGNYVVVSPRWDNGGIADVGAVTWGSATQGVTGLVSPQNSLIGASIGDNVGSSSWNAVVPLTNGNYVVSSSAWDNGAVADVGAATWGNGTSGTVGVVGVGNSLIGATAGDMIGSQTSTPNGTPIALSNGNYVIASINWHHGATNRAGAVTWGDGSGPTVGVVGTGNSLVGSTTNDGVGTRVVALSNGNYVVASHAWDGAFTNAGAVTWRDGSGPTPAIVSSSNSLVGVATNQFVGSLVTPLTNGNYVIGASGIDAVSSAAGMGAAIWVDGSVGASGPIIARPALVGSTAGDTIGNIVYALANGHYVTCSSRWSNGAFANAGAVTWGNGITGTSGVVSPANSLVGTKSDDYVCNFNVAALSNGNYVVTSERWDNGAITNAGAVTWGNGNGGTVGPVTTGNSLVGVSAGDEVGYSGGVTPLSDGNYVVVSYSWDNGSIVDAGAVTWRDGSASTSGVISVANSLVGTTADDRIGNGFAFALPGGRYFVISGDWDNGLNVNARAATLGAAGGSTVGPLSPTNSVAGEFPTGVDWESARERLAVGHGTAVSFISYDTLTFDGFE